MQGALRAARLDKLSKDIAVGREGMRVDAGVCTSTQTHGQEEEEGVSVNEAEERLAGKTGRELGGSEVKGDKGRKHSTGKG